MKNDLQVIKIELIKLIVIFNIQICKQQLTLSKNLKD